ncbi:MAG: hypothetical protein K6E29_07125 [Cyanobacteria bacterium RUI128]|nr:hypothetical protein [Cyanobacteria bacterium RUI128]
MENNFSIGLIVGIVIGVIGMNFLCPGDEPQTSSSVQTTTSGNYYSGDYDDYGSYEEHGLHERGMH